VSRIIGSWSQEIKKTTLWTSLFAKKTQPDNFKIKKRTHQSISKSYSVASIIPRGYNVLAPIKGIEQNKSRPATVGNGLFQAGHFRVNREAHGSRTLIMTGHIWVIQSWNRHNHRTAY